MSSVQSKAATQSQKLMIFVLTMSLYGLATLFTELIPKFQVGLVEFSVEYFLFIPLTLAMLFDPLSEIHHGHHWRLHRGPSCERSQESRYGGRRRHRGHRCSAFDGYDRRYCQGSICG